MANEVWWGRLAAMCQAHRLSFHWPLCLIRQPKILEYRLRSVVNERVEHFGPIADDVHRSQIRGQEVNEFRSVVMGGHTFRLVLGLPKRWVVERSFAWSARFRRLTRDYEKLPATFAGYNWLAFITIMLSALFIKS